MSGKRRIMTVIMEAMTVAVLMVNIINWNDSDDGNEDEVEGENHH